MSKSPIIPLNCFFQGCYNPEYEAEIRKAKDLCFKYNQLSPNDTEAQKPILEKLLGSVGKSATLTPPFWCDYGYHITVGDNFYSNHNLIIQDGGGVSFGDNVFIAPNCCFTTAEHAIDPEMRKAGVEIAMPIKIGNNVWIGAGCTVLAGVEIGDNTVIGAGSVVTKSIPANVVAVGVPCRVLREITEKDKTSYPMYNELALRTSYVDSNGAEGNYRQISMDEALRMMEEEKDYIILDVRRPDEYAEGHIPGAINVVNEEIGDSEISELPSKSQLILVYCRSGRRSKEAAQKLAMLGYTNIVEFGGILDWNGEIEK